MAGTVRVKNVEIKLNRAALDRIRQRSKSELQTWARDVLTRKVEPVTPIDTGELRRSADVSVQGGEQVNVVWYWKTDYAGSVETMGERRASPKTPGTIAPFGEPTIREAIEQEIKLPISKAFGGGD